jgi:streptogramin lyase
MELDPRNQVVWLPLEGLDVVIRKDLSGATVGPDLIISGPVDVSVSDLRGIGWVASATAQRVVSFGPDLADPSPQLTINAIGHPRAVEAGTLDVGVWIGNDEGSVFRLRPQDGVLTDAWDLGSGGIREIALDEVAGAAWIATRSGTTGDLYYLTHADSTRRLIRSGLINVADLAVDPVSGDLWISERGEPGIGAGRLTRVARDGATLATLAAIEPYGIDVDPVDGTVWVSDLRSDRILRVDRNCAILSRSPLLSEPYAVRVHIP